MKNMLLQLMKTILIGLSLLITPMAMAAYDVSRDTPTWFKETFYDFSEDVAEAAADNKRLMIYFGQNGCPYCEKLHNDSFYQSSIVKKIRSNFDSIAINIFGDIEVTWIDGNDYTEKELTKKLGIQFTPSLLFLDEDGKEILTVAGYQPPQKMLALLDYVANKKETEEPFADYIRAFQKTNAAKAISVGYPDKFIQPPFNTNHQTKKRAVLVVQDNCQFCVEWQDLLNSDKTKQWRDQFEMMQFNINNKAITIDSTISENQWINNKNIAFVPTLVFFDTDGTEIMRADGYLRTFHLESVLDYVLSDAYKTEPEFQRFLQARAEHQREQGIDVIIW